MFWHQLLKNPCHEVSCVRGELSSAIQNSWKKTDIKACSPSAPNARMFVVSSGCIPIKVETKCMNEMFAIVNKSRPTQTGGFWDLQLSSKRWWYAIAVTSKIKCLVYCGNAKFTFLCETMSKICISVANTIAGSGAAFTSRINLHGWFFSSLHCCIIVNDSSVAFLLLFVFAWTLHVVYLLHVHSLVIHLDSVLW